MTKKREAKKPKIVWVGSTPITPISDKESRTINKRIRKRREKLRQRYPEVHDKVVDYISHSIEDGTLFFSVAFRDKTNFSLRFANEMFIVVHRHKQVQNRTRTKNQLQAMALSHGVQKKWKLWTKAGRAELEQLPLLPYAAERRQHLLEALDALEADIDERNRRVEEEVRKRPEAVRLMTHPGVGPVTALAMVLTLGPAERFASGKEVGSYFGLIPSEESSGGKQRLGKISKQGSSFLRFLLVEAGQTAARYDPQLKRFYGRLAVRKNRGVAKVAGKQKPSA